MRILVDSKNSYLKEALARIGTVTLVPTPAVTRNALLEADAVIVRSETRVDARLLEGTPVRFVGTATIGVDHLDTAYLSERGIAFANAPGSNAESVAQYSAAALLVLASTRKTGLAGASIGIVGCGNVGARVARVAAGMGMRVLLNDPPLRRSTGDERFLPLDSLMGADVISLHVPLTHSGQDATYHAFDEERLCRMKPGSVLINTARGAVVDTGALKRALRSGQISAAILDVWENEPAIDLELLGLALIATPHIAGYSLDGKLNAARMIFEALRAYTGAAAAWEAPPELPQPGSPSIDSRGIAADGHVWLDEIVNRCYDIRRDCESLQQSLLLPDTERAHWFRELRATYPIRREFASTTVLVSTERSEEGAALRALGFVVREA